MSAASFFLSGLNGINEGDIRLGTDTLMLTIVNDDYVFDKETVYFDTGDDDVNDPSANILAATGYADQDLTGLLTFFSILTGSGKSAISFPDTNFGALGGAANDTVAGLILWKDSGVPTTSPVIAYFPVLNPTATTGVNVVMDFKTEAEGGQIRFTLPAQS